MIAIKKAVYSAIDTITGGRGIARNFHGETVRFPPRWSRYFKTDYEPETFAFLRTSLQPGHSFLDIGVHIGLFSVVAARLVGEAGRVIAFEPTPSTRSVMTEVLRVNGFEKFVEVRSEAVSRESGTTTFYDSGDEISVVNSLVQGDRKSGFEVNVVTLDEFCSTEIRPDCIKIDVEGSELDLLAGAERVLAEARPKILLSIHPPFVPNGREDIEQIWSFLERHRYNAAYEGRLVTREWFCSKPELFDVVLTAAE